MRIIGCDIGTMNLVASRKIDDKKVEINTLRNMFLEVDTNMISSVEISNSSLDYVEAKDEDGEIEGYYIIGEDAYKFGNIFAREARRPMSQGVISSSDIDAVDVLTLMVERLVGKTKKGYCVYSIPAQSIDLDVPPVLYHERVFGRIFQTLGYQSKPLNEAMAIIYSECQNTNFSGLAISYGAGLTNVACAYKGTPTMTFSISRGGDWIDAQSAQSLGILPTRVTAIKERDLDLLNPIGGKKKERRVKEALAFFYSNLIEYSLKHLISKFNENSDGLEINEQIPIIVSGGTSKVTGFVDVFKEVFNKQKDFPYEISEIRSAGDPLACVSYGCLLYALWEKKKSGEIKEEKDS